MANVIFSRGEGLTPGSDIVIVHKDGAVGPQGLAADPLGMGASGAVYRAIQNGIIPRAVKVLAPSDELLEHFSLEELITVFEKEKWKLSQLTHSHIAKLISFGVYSRDGFQGPMPYLLMEFVEGIKLHEYLISSLRKDAHNKQAEAVGIVVALLDDVLAALHYMHERDALHADIKEANVLVRAADRPEAVLVDLGCAHIFTKPLTDERTYFNGTRSRNDDKWGPLVNHPVTQAELHEERVRIDLYQFGMMLRILLRIVDRTHEKDYEWQEATRKVLSWAVGPLGGDTLSRISEKCIQKQYMSADAVRRDIAVLRPAYAAPLGVSELSMGTDAVTSISLPEGRVPLTSACRSLVNHPCVQRLHNICQLDFLRMVFPGASHTRFLHSLEAYDLTRQYVAALCGDPVFRAYAADRDSIQAILAGGLVHDVGHYPLEHVFEDFAAKRENRGPYANVLTDDQVVRAMLSVGPEAERASIRDAIGEFCEVASLHLREPIPPIPEIIGRTYAETTLGRLRELLYPQPGDIGAHLLHTILDGPIDVDKVAYLRTDALMTGARYGRAIDTDVLLGSLMCFRGSMFGETTVGPSIAIRTKGVCAAEAIATARRWMFQRVYWNHSNRAMMAMLRFPIQYMLDRGALTFDTYFAKTYGLTDIEAVKWVDREFAATVKAEGKDIPNPAQCLLEGRRILYKRLLELGAKDGGQRAAARNYLQQRSCGEWLALAASVAEEIRKKVNIYDSDILLDIPVYDRPGLDDLPVFSGSEWTMMTQLSDEYRQTKAFFNAGSMYCRVFVHPRVRQELVDAGAKGYVEKAILERLGAP